MALLASTLYDPGTAGAKATTSLLVVTALDTTNLRLTFTGPSNGCVLVRIRTGLAGATTYPSVLLAVLDGATIKARLIGRNAAPGSNSASIPMVQEALFAITGLTNGTSYTWDAAYAVDLVLASTNLRYGGPNDVTGGNAWGAIQFEIYEAPNLLAAALYDPASSVSKSTASLLAMTAIDTTNLRLVFTVPPSGSVMVRLSGVTHGATTFPVILLGVLEGSTVRGRQSPIGGLAGTALATTKSTHTAEFVVTGLNPGDSLTWDAAYGVEIVLASTGLKYGGPNDTTTDNAFGGFLFEVYAL